MQTPRTVSASVPARRRFGDRKDGRLVRTLPAMTKLMPFIMRQRCDALNSFSDEFEVSNAEAYIREKRAEGKTDFTMLHLLIAAYVRTVSQRPGLNRFVSGQRIYARNCVEINFVVKKEMKLESPDSSISVRLQPDATADEVYTALHDAIESAKTEETSFDDTARILDMLPRLVKRFVVGLIFAADYWGLLPKWLTDLSPFHGSFFVTSMASIGLPPVFHHIYNLGNVPIFMAYGITKKRLELQKDGTTAEKRYMGYTVVMDERTCDGYYFASAFRYLSGIMRNPHMLDQKPEKVERDID